MVSETYRPTLIVPIDPDVNGERRRIIADSLATGLPAYNVVCVAGMRGNAIIVPPLEP